MDLKTLIPVIAGIVLSLLLTYFPTLKTWYAKQAAAQKALIVLGLSLVVALAYFGIACTPWAIHLGVVVACTSDGFWVVATAFGEIVASSQVAYLLTPTQVVTPPVVPPVVPPAG
jgi:hypothetical protein